MIFLSSYLYIHVAHIFGTKFTNDVLGIVIRFQFLSKIFRYGYEKTYDIQSLVEATSENN